MHLPIVNCNDCGMCCMHMNVPPFTYMDGDEPPSEFKQEIDLYVNSVRYSDDAIPCMWLDVSTGKCKHYDHRPAVCKDFEVGGESCQLYRKEANIPHP